MLSYQESEINLFFFAIDIKKKEIFVIGIKIPLSTYPFINVEWAIAPVIIV
jgi:hypothetical protein